VLEGNRTMACKIVDSQLVHQTAAIGFHGLGERNSVLAVSALDLPSTISCRIWRSRGFRPYKYFMNQ
jgi:hypothetical protein